jgi:hypothetical protein
MGFSLVRRRTWMLPRYTCFSARLMGSQRLRIQVEYSMFTSLVVLGGHNAMSSREWWGTGWGRLIGGAHRQMQPIPLHDRSVHTTRSGYTFQCTVIQKYARPISLCVVVGIADFNSPVPQIAGASTSLVKYRSSLRRAPQARRKSAVTRVSTSSAFDVQRRALPVRTMLRIGWPGMCSEQVYFSLLSCHSRYLKLCTPDYRRDVRAAACEGRQMARSCGRDTE